ncbi:translation initiation factor IF-3 [Octopus vulgaris]|uniref:Translation initiation factor IF-3 n=1 Tax=Octopus vulgaris TaxID=6645 RepID=A0AA36BEK8_OCTVU|nr:translation initiation factor IF-3 [Octopus vulgaris]
MAAIAVGQRRIFTSLYRPLLHLSQLKPCTAPVSIQVRFASTGKQPKFKKSNAISKLPVGQDTEEETPKLIKLFDESGCLLPVVEKDEAQKLAKLKELKLVQISEDKLEPHYQLMTGKQLTECRLTQKKSKKEKSPIEKTLHVKSTISEHDFLVKLNKMKELLEKNINIRMKIKVSNCDNETESRGIQLKFMKRITEETSSLASIKEASSTATEIIVLLRKKTE